MAQQVEHVLGKDEVTGSNPVISSKRKDNSWLGCLFFFRWAFATALLGYISISLGVRYARQQLQLLGFRFAQLHLHLTGLSQLRCWGDISDRYLFDCKQIKCNERVINNIYLQKRLSFTFERESFG